MHPWGKLDRLTTRLLHNPRSEYRAELLNDPEYAEWALAQPDDGKQWRPDIRDWTPDLAALTEVKDLLAQLIAATVASATGKAAKVPPLSPRPHTAIDRAKKKAAEARLSSLVDEVYEAQARWAATHGG